MNPNVRLSSHDTSGHIGLIWRYLVAQEAQHLFDIHHYNPHFDEPDLEHDYPLVLVRRTDSHRTQVRRGKDVIAAVKKARQL